MAYMNVEEIEAALDALAASHPDVTELVALPQQDPGRSAVLPRPADRPGGRAGRNALLVVIGRIARARMGAARRARQPRRRPARGACRRAPACAMAGRASRRDEMRSLVEGCSSSLFPCVNPDGRHHSQTAEPMWRKNRRRVSADLDPRCVGVDLNRNFDALWDFRRHFAPDSGVSASDDPCHPQVYVGPAADSEPETQNVVWLFDRYPDTRWFIDVHSYVPAIYHTWGFDENQTSDPSMSFLNPAFDGQRGRAGDAYREFIPRRRSRCRSRTLGSRDERGDHGGERSGAGYELGQSFSLYPTSGTSDDYAYRRHFVDGGKARSWALRSSAARSFQPPWAEAEDVIRELCAGLVAFSLAAMQQAGASTGVAA